VVLVIPGPGVLYILARSLSQGQRAGVVSAAGLSVGALVHVVAATVGLSALLLASAAAFGIVKALGAAYLIYLGLRTILAKGSPGSAEAPSRRPHSRLFKDGVVVSVLNPKIAVFFLAFLPQFVDPQVAPVSQQVLLLGGLYALLAFFTDSAYAVLAARLRTWMSGPVAQGPIPRYASGSVYIGLGIGTALTDLEA